MPPSSGHLQMLKQIPARVETGFVFFKAFVYLFSSGKFNNWGEGTSAQLCITLSSISVFWREKTPGRKSVKTHAWNVCCDTSSQWAAKQFSPKKTKRQIGNVSNPLLVSLSALRPPQQHQAPEVGCCAVGRVRHLGTSGSNSSPASRMVNI